MVRVTSLALAVAVAVAISSTAIAQDARETGLSEEGLLPPGVTVEGGEEATVVEVVDGDTIKVDRGTGVTETVRYIGMDTPETVDPSEPVQPFGPEATAANEELVSGQTVILEKDTSETDQYGRLLRYVWLPTDEGLLLVNNELVRRGLAVAKAYEPDTRYQEFLSMTATKAAADALGLFGPETVEPAVPARERTDPSYLRPRRYNSNLTWRWFNGADYDCLQSEGCYAMKVRTRAACTKRLDVTLDILDADGFLVNSVSRSKRTVRKGQTLTLIFDSNDSLAEGADVARMRCLQKPKPKPKPSPPVRRASRPRASSCTPGYSPCLPPASDYDCAGGSGNGPRYTGFVRVTGSDPYGLDADNDGAGCE
jgi:micrococcal nuclease